MTPEEITKMTLKEVIERLAKLDIEVRESQDVEFIEEAAEEKKELLTRKAELEAIEERKKTALALDAGSIEARVIETRGDRTMDFENMTAEELRGSPEYRSAFLKRLQGKELNDIEKRANEMASSDVVGAIPTQTYERIINKLKQHAPLLDEITLLHVAGNVRFAIEGTNTAAEQHAENALISPAADTMATVTLGGYEIVKVLRISKTVETMAINAFEDWLVEILSENIAAKIGEWIIYGNGSGEPKGIDYSATWADNTNAVIPAGTKYPTQAELVELISYLKGGYHRGAKFLMNSQDFWGGIVALQSNDKFKVLTDDYKYLLGFEVLLDDNVADGDIFFGNFKKVVGNLSQDIVVDRSEHSGFAYNSIDYRGAAIFDCDVAVNECFVKCAKVLTAGK